MKTSHKEDLYERVTTAIIETLEQGQGTSLEWLQSGRGMPCNHQTGTAYQGVNVLLLWADAAAAGYTSDRWLTYRQAVEMGGQVRKGERSVTCIFFKTLERASQTESDDTDTSESFCIIKPFWLFNLDQRGRRPGEKPLWGLSTILALNVKLNRALWVLAEKIPKLKWESIRWNQKLAIFKQPPDFTSHTMTTIKRTRN